jgi:adenylate cyclase
MNAESINRKLTAILSADAKGYSRLMGEDEIGTVQLLKEYRDIMAQLIHQDRGRVVDSPGDNILAEFGSVVDATGCAVKIQEKLKTKNAELSENKRLEFRIGINLGDVLEDGDRIYGDGVNIAARIEGIADPGGICISRTAYDQLKNKLELGFQYLGEHSVKNITEPVRVYRVLMEPEAIGKVIGEKRFLGRISRRVAISTIIVLVLVAVGLISYNIYLHQSKKVEPASLDKMAFPLPDKPSIAVLPFDNLSNDPDQEYFSDGLTEDIITGLSTVPSLFVIARNSSFIYKGKPVKVQQVSEELGVRYVLEGSVRKEGDRVRITAQLIDAISGYHKWSKRYDRKMYDIFDLQDEIMRDLLNEMRVQLIEGERARLWHQEFRDKKLKFEAYEKQMKSRWHFFQMNPEGFAMSKKLAEEAIEIEPNYYAPYVMLAFLSRRNPPLAYKYAQKALELNDSAPMALITMGQMYLDRRQWDKAIAMGERALALDPNGAEVKNHLGNFLSLSSRYEEAIVLLEEAIRLNPYPPSFFYVRLAGAYQNVGRYDEAVEMCKKGLKRNPRDLYARIILTGVYMLQGREEEAQDEAKIILKSNPKFSLRPIIELTPKKDKLALNTFVEALRKAGLPD